MRLLHSMTLCLTEFNETNTPPYAILSHRWEEGEVSLQEICSHNVDQKAGYQKIKNFCQTAAADGFEYVWVDTCNIDKTNSAELSEAINSMYRWYKNSKVCYAYLSDVDSDEDPNAPDSSFRKSVWFRRGWTLQELIAPPTVLFYGCDWKEVGTSSSLQNVIEAVTGIHVSAFLDGHDNLQKFSIAQKMSWAAKRQTTRTEDLAYCLLGLFDINMPMIYGEGEGAFIRLQEEIIKRSDDPSIFAWRSTFERAWCGLLATSPSFFEESRNIVRSRGNNTSFSLTNKGVYIQMPMSEVDVQRHIFLGLLNCHDKDNGYSFEILLMKDYEDSDDGRRYLSDELEVLRLTEGAKFRMKEMYVKQLPRNDYFRKFSRKYTQYRIRTANIQEHYPRALISSSGMIRKDLSRSQERHPRALISSSGMIRKDLSRSHIMGAIRVAVHGSTRAILLKIEHFNLSARIAANSDGMSLAQIVLDCNPEEGPWIEAPGRIVEEISPGCRWFISWRRQLVLGARTLTLDVCEQPREDSALGRRV